MCLVGEVLRAFVRISPDDSLHYDKVKMAFLHRFGFTGKGYRETLRESSLYQGETGGQCAARLEVFFLPLGGGGTLFQNIRRSTGPSDG